MDAVVNAMSKLQALNLADKPVRNLLEAAGCPPLQEARSNGSTAAHEMIALGGPHTGFFEDVPGLLAGIIASHNKTVREPACTLRRDPGSNDIIVTSAFKELPEVHIPPEELASLQQRIVFCHNDLEPRNLLVRPAPSSDGTVRYELAAILDWEVAGLFPFAYEYCMKDALLGGSNLYFTWYTLFKQRTASSLPATGLPDCGMPFKQALDLVYQSLYKRRTRNCGALFRAKWIEREQLMPGPSLWSGCGWSQKDLSNARGSSPCIRRIRRKPSEHDSLDR
ncbi:MAG: hypothetical protein M1816_001224 [Peltula sp. TS41687]|nr:MAG: hypothetical protein M1816_001224 [Peltula sp. TS41687]